MRNWHEMNSGNYCKSHNNMTWIGASEHYRLMANLKLVCVLVGMFFVMRAIISFVLRMYAYAQYEQEKRKKKKESINGLEIDDLSMKKKSTLYAKAPLHLTLTCVV